MVATSSMVFLIGHTQLKDPACHQNVPFPEMCPKAYPASAGPASTRLPATGPSELLALNAESYCFKAVVRVSWNISGFF